MEEKRCPHCNKLFFMTYKLEVKHGFIEVYCNRCKKYIVFK